VEDVGEMGFGDVAQAEVLAEGGAQDGIAERLEEKGEANGVLVAEVAEEDRNEDGEQAGLLLRFDVALLPEMELRRVIRGGGEVGRDGGGGQILKGEGRGRLVAYELQLLFVQLAEALFAEGVPEEAKTCGVAVLAVAVLVEEAFDRCRHGVDIVGGDELVQQVADLRLGAQTAGNVDAEALLPVAKLGDEANIVEARVACVRLGVGEGDLELARQHPGVGLGDEAGGEGERVRAGVEDFIDTHAGVGRDEDVADGVAAASARDEADAQKLAHGGDHVLKRDVVDLELLAGGDVDPGAAVARGDLGHGLQLRRRVRAAGGADAHHVTAVAALLVAAERDAADLERGGVQLALLMTLNIAIEFFEFGGEVCRNLIGHWNSLRGSGTLDFGGIAWTTTNGGRRWIGDGSTGCHGTMIAKRRARGGDGGHTRCGAATRMLLRPMRRRTSRPGYFEVSRTTTVTMGSSGLAGSWMSRLSPVWVSFRGLCAESARRYAFVTLRGSLSRWNTPVGQLKISR
jgi:hypothetical protein